MSLIGAEQKLSCSSEIERQEEGRSWGSWHWCPEHGVAVGQTVLLEHRAYPKAHLQEDDIEPNVLQDRPMTSFVTWDWLGLPRSITTF